MVRKLAWVAAALVLCACAQHALGMGSLVSVTKQTQGRLGLDYMLAANRVDDEAVLVRIEIPRTGKLKALRSVGMRIGSGRPLVAVTLQTTPGKDGSWVATFQVSPTLADRCSIDLIVPTGGMEYTVYAVELKDYITTRGIRPTPSPASRPAAPP